MSAVASEVFVAGSEDSGEHSNTQRLRKKYLSMSPRCGVLSYNARVLFALCVAGLLSAPFAIAVSTSEEGAISGMPMALAAVAFFVAIVSFLFFCVITGVQRLHDLGHKGIYILVCIVPVVGTLFSIYISMCPGKRSENAYGEWQAPSTASVVGGSLMLAVIVLCYGAYAYTAIS